jgi:Flp pilus assembly protein TadD
VRVFSFIILSLLLVAIGCAVPGMPGSKQAAPPNTLGANQAAEQSSWTQKMAAPWKKLAGKDAPAPGADLSSDPISLQFASGPPTPSLYVSMAQLSDQGGNAASARGLYQKALEMEPTHLEATLGLAHLEDRAGNMQPALQFYQKAVQEHPQDARPLNDLALCQARMGNMPVALQCLNQAVQLKPDKPLYRNNIAKVLIELNQLDQAVGHLTTVSDPAVANYNMAVLLQQRGRSAEAVDFLQQALTVNPQMSEAHTLLATLTPANPAIAGTAVATVSGTLPVGTTEATVSSPGIQVSQLYSTGSNDNILPTPMFPPGQVAAEVVYPNTGAPPLIPKPQNVPCETAQVPVGYAPNPLPQTR